MTDIFSKIKAIKSTNTLEANYKAGMEALEKNDEEAIKYFAKVIDGNKLAPIYSKGIEREMEARIKLIEALLNKYNKKVDESKKKETGDEKEIENERKEISSTLELALDYAIDTSDTLKVYIKKLSYDYQHNLNPYKIIIGGLIKEIDKKIQREKDVDEIVKNMQAVYEREKLSSNDMYV